MYELKMPPQVVKKIKKLKNKNLIKKIENILKSPKVHGRALSGNLKGLWRARINPFRVIYEIDEENKVVTIVKIENRDSSYK